MKQHLKRCLIIESLSYHWEVLAPWVDMMKLLGIDTEIAISGTAGHLETVALLGLDPSQVHDVRNLGSLALDRFDFVLLNTLVHAGYFFPAEPVPRPDLAFVRQLQRPSICVIHEPIQWVEKLVVHSFTEVGNGAGTIINLLADGCSVRQGGFWSDAKWSQDGDSLWIPYGGGIREFKTVNCGQTYQCTDNAAISLHRRTLPIEDLKDHLKLKQHAAIALTAEGAHKLEKIHDGIEWVLPFKIEQPCPSRVDGPIAFAGTIDYDRKSIPSLLNAAKSLKADEKILIIGGSRDPDFDNDCFVQTFKRQIAELGLGEKFLFTGYLPYGQFVEQVKQCRFIIPLIDDYVDSGAYLIKLPAMVPLSLGLGVPMIMSGTVSGSLGSDILISYPGQDLVSGLQQCREMDKDAYLQLVENLHRKAQLLYANNLQKLSTIINNITGLNTGD